jgi:signal transduction histidine kinase
MPQAFAPATTFRWRLTVSSIATAFVALVVLELAAAIVPATLDNAALQRPLGLLDGMQRLAAQTPVPLTATTSVGDWLHTSTGAILVASIVSPSGSAQGYLVQPGGNASLVVLNHTSQVVAWVGPGTNQADQVMPFLAQPAAQAAIQAAFTPQPTATDLLRILPDGSTVVAVPISAHQENAGVLALHVNLVALRWQADLNALLSSIIPFSLIAIVLGTGVGLLLARQLTHRLSRLAAATDAWHHGDFTVLVHDRIPDELGRLGQQLNHMVAALQALMHTREHLSAVEERQRLARDLHDAVKQQLFAVAMQVGAARELGARDPVAAIACFNVIEQGIVSALKELTGLIQQLRPPALSTVELGTAIRVYVEEWMRLTGIVALVRVQGQQPTPPEIEEALFRITQEALANVARHSGATQVWIALWWTAEQVGLTIADNGRGGDPAAMLGHGVGLRSMQERMQRLGGTWAIRQAAEGGVGIEVTAPFATPPPRLPPRV